MEKGTGNPLVQPFNVYTIASGERVQHVGGSYDAPSAVALAGAVLMASQGQTSQIPLLYVYDNLDQVVAFVGDTGKVL